MEPILKGWLTKSPPDNKSSGHWNIFGAKWKRRFFVLYAPPMTVGITESRAAMLEYYTSKKLNTKVGFINLDDCDEVLSNLDSDTYKNVFSLHTKHKSRERTYYLVADTEEEMNSWVNQLCRVLGLLENDENKVTFSPEGRQFKPYTATTPKPIPNFQTHTNRLIPPGSSVPNSALGNRFNNSEPNLLDRGMFTLDRRPRSNMPEFTNYHSDSNVVFDNDSKKLKSAASVPDIDFMPTSGNLMSASIKPREQMELPPIPPEKSRKSTDNLTQLENLDGSRKSKVINSNMTVTLSEEACLGPPPPKPPKEKKSVSVKNVEADFDDKVVDVVSLPPKASKAYKNYGCINSVNENSTGKKHLTKNIKEESYDIPKELELNYDSPTNFKSVSSREYDDEDEVDCAKESEYNTPRSMFSADTLKKQQQQQQTQQNQQQQNHDQYQQHTKPPIPASRKSIINKNYKPSIVSTSKNNFDDEHDDDFYDTPKKPNNNIVEDNVDNFYNVPKSNNHNTESAIDFYDVPHPRNISQHPRQQNNPISYVDEDMYDAPKHTFSKKSTKLTTSPSTKSTTSTTSTATPPTLKPVPARRTKVVSHDSKSEGQGMTKIKKQDSVKPPISAKPSLVKRESSKQALKQQFQPQSTTTTTTSTMLLTTQTASTTTSTSKTSLTTTTSNKTLTATTSSSSSTATSKSQTITGTSPSFAAATKKAYKKKTKGPTTTIIHESIRFTQRSKSFKRSITGQDLNNVQMPVKRGDKEASSSDNSDSEE